MADFVAPPGRVFNYSNLGIALVGCVIESVTGHYFPYAMQELVYEPLGMRHTTYDRTVAMTYPVALPHRYNDEGHPYVQHRMFDFAAGNPAGQVMASTGELARFALMCINEGKVGSERFLAAGSLREMLTPHAWLLDGKDTRYGLTFWLQKYKGVERVGHCGTLWPYLCDISFFPGEGIGIVFQCSSTNEFSPWSIRDLIADQLLDLPPSAPRGPIRTKDDGQEGQEGGLERYAGTYLSLSGAEWQRSAPPKAAWC